MHYMLNDPQCLRLLRQSPWVLWLWSHGCELLYGAAAFRSLLPKRCFIHPRHELCRSQFAPPQHSAVQVVASLWSIDQHSFMQYSPSRACNQSQTGSGVQFPCKSCWQETHFHLIFSFHSIHCQLPSEWGSFDSFFLGSKSLLDVSDSDFPFPLSVPGASCLEIGPLMYVLRLDGQKPNGNWYRFPASHAASHQELILTAYHFFLAGWKEWIQVHSGWRVGKLSGISKQLQTPSNRNGVFSSMLYDFLESNQWQGS